MSYQHMWLVITGGLAMFGLGFVDNYAAKLILVIAVLASVAFVDKKEKIVLGWIMILIICIFAQWGVAQFVLQHDLGLRLIGESVINSSMSGVAKFGNGIVRGYGPFEHANILGGLCLLALIMTERLWGERGAKIIFVIIVFTLGFGLCMAFSRAAILGWILLASGIFAMDNSNRRYLSMNIIVLFMIVLWPLLSQRLNDSRDVAKPERLRGYEWSVQIMKLHNDWTGLGVRNYKMELRSYLDAEHISYQPWEIDYVHSVPLMILSQIGAISGSLIIIGILLWMLMTLGRTSMIILAALVPVILLDHFFVTKLGALVYLIIAVSIIKASGTYRLKYV